VENLGVVSIDKRVHVWYNTGVKVIHERHKLMKNHCQICAREIKANTGLIAHHGYQRPGSGWQTASCDGAKQLPYEVSRDYIPVVIERYKMAAANQEALADEMLRTPAATITRHHMSGFTGKETHTTDFTKPDGFDPYAAVNSGARSFSFSTYENEFVKQYEMHRSYQKDILATIEFLQKRYDDWRAA
jgi:hypothetical protein